MKLRKSDLEKSTLVVFSGEPDSPLFRVVDNNWPRLGVEDALLTPPNGMSQRPQWVDASTAMPPSIAQLKQLDR